MTARHYRRREVVHCQVSSMIARRSMPVAQSQLFGAQRDKDLFREICMSTNFHLHFTGLFLAGELMERFTPLCVKSQFLCL